MDDHIVDKGPIPNERIKLVSGEVVFEEEHPRVRLRSLTRHRFARLMLDGNILFE